MLSVLDYLKLDAENRHAKGRLFVKTYEEIKDNKHYDFKTFMEGINNATPALSYKTFDKPSYVIAGGCFKANKHDAENNFTSDVDIFVYKNHQRTLDNLIDTVCEGHYRLTKYTVDFQRARTAHQVILRKYTSIAEILYGFDLGPSQVAYDGYHFYFTVMSLLALETGIMIIDTTRRSTSFERRIVKYIGKGFKPIYPFGNFSSTNDLKVIDKENNPSPYFTIIENKFIPLKAILLANNYSIEKGILPANRLFIKELLTGNGNFRFKNGEVCQRPVIRYYQQLLSLNILSNKCVYTDEYKKEVMVKTNKQIKKAYNGFEVKYNWIEKNPGSQDRNHVSKIHYISENHMSKSRCISENLLTSNLLTASLNPIIEKPVEWYGGYYAPTFGPKIPTYLPQ